MEIYWDQITQTEWEDLADLALAPMQQRWIYGQIHASLGGATTRAVVYKAGKPVAICQCICRPFAGLINISLATRGPVWLAACNKASVLNLIKKTSPVSWPHAQLFTLPNANRCLRAIPLMTPATHATIKLPVARKTLHIKWRNSLKKAENSNLCVRHTTCNAPALLEILQTDHQQQIDKSYRGLPADFSLQWHNLDAKGLRLITVGKGRETIASALFIRHGNTASYHIAHTSTLGRKLSAQRLVLWRAFNDFTNQGTRQIDLGSIDTVNAAGLARFKLGTGAKATQFGPTVLAI